MDENEENDEPVSPPPAPPEQQSILVKNQTSSNMSKVMQPSKPVSNDIGKSNDITEAAPMNKLRNNAPKEVRVDPAKNVEKLPSGVNLVTMKRPGLEQPIQVKLPVTLANQHWCTIRVDLQVRYWTFLF